MFKGLNKLQRDDSGFTVVEIVVSAFILFFALTAIIGLLGMTTNMTAGAKSKSVLNNAIASEMDRIRSLPYSAIAYPTPGGPGQVEHVRGPVPVGGFQVTYTTTIVDRSGSTGTKEITLVGVATREGFPTTTSRSFAAVRNRVGGVTVSNGTVPTIAFTSVTPKADSIVVANKTASNDLLTIGVRAASGGERTISRIEIVAGTSGGNVLLRDGTTIYAHDAEQDYPGAPNTVEVFSFTWHTGQVNEANEKSIPDGRRVIRAIAYDDQGRASAPRERTFIVDNFVPSLPGGVTFTGTAQADMSQQLTPAWTTPMDGTDPAPYVEGQILEDRNGAASLDSWDVVAQQQSPATIVAAPFGRYVLRARGLSPLRNPSDWAVSSRVFTRPIINGTSDITRAKRTNSQDRWTFVTRFNIPKPRYPYNAGATTVQVLENGVAVATLDSAAVLAAWNGGNPYAFSRTLVMDMGKNVTPNPPQYQLRVAITPLGWGGGSQITVTSNLAKPWAPADEAAFKYTTPPNTISQTAMPLTVSW